MDEIEIQGKKYISSKRAAELTGYAKDYIGQLARSQKIDATRFGRAWYVSLEAITKQAGISLPNPITSGLSSDAPNEKNLISLAQLQHAQPGYFKTWSSVSYSSEDPMVIKMPIALEHISPEHTKSIVRIRKAAEELKERRLDSSIQGITSPEITQEKILLVGKAALSDLVVGGLVIVIVGVASLNIALLGVETPSQWNFYREFDGRLALAASFSGTEFLEPILLYFDDIFSDGMDLLGSYTLGVFSGLELLFNTGINFVLNILDFF